MFGIFFFGLLSATTYYLVFKKDHSVLILLDQLVLSTDLINSTHISLLSYA